MLWLQLFTDLIFVIKTMVEIFEKRLDSNCDSHSNLLGKLYIFVRCIGSSYSFTWD